MAGSMLLALALMGGGDMPMALACRVEGGGKSGLDDHAVCARFAEGLSAASGRSYRLAPAGARIDSGMTVVVRFMGRDTVAAEASLIAAGRAQPLETRMVSTSDRALGLDSIALLARDVARAMNPAG